MSVTGTMCEWLYKLLVHINIKYFGSKKDPWLQFNSQDLNTQPLACLSSAGTAANNIWVDEKSDAVEEIMNYISGLYGIHPRRLHSNTTFTW